MSVKSSVSALVLAHSYEDRAAAYLQRCVASNVLPSHVFVVGFSDYSYKPSQFAHELERQAFDDYWSNVQQTAELISTTDVHCDSMDLDFGSIFAVERLMEKIVQFDKLTIDITCFPRYHLAAIIHRLSMLAQAGKSIKLAYTRPQRHLDDEDRYSSGVRGFATIPGLAGHIRHTKSFAIVVSGFEGNRAYSAFRHLDPHAAALIIGESHDNKEDSYIAIAQRNNHQLLGNPRVQKYSAPSLDPKEFAEALSSVIARAKEEFSSPNIYVVPVGTKMQTIGCVLAARAHPEVQILFTCPTFRRKSTVGVGSTTEFDLGELTTTVKLSR